MKLYHSTGSANSRRVRIFLAEKGLELALVPVDLGKREQRSDEYRMINPRQMVPTVVLEDGTANRRGAGHLALSRRGLSIKAASGRNAQGKGACGHVGTARGTRRLRGRDGGRPQRSAGPRPAASSGKSSLPSDQS